MLAVIAAELVWLITRGGWNPVDATLRLLPGALLVLAIRAALTGMAWPWIAGLLVMSLPAHIADLSRRSSPPPTGGGE